MNWVEGTGRYIGDDGSTYVVVRSDTNTSEFVLIPGTFGRGNAARRVIRRQGKLVVLARDGERTQTSNAPEIVLEDNMHGFWESSGQVLYLAEHPGTQPEQMRDAKKPAPPETTSGGQSQATPVANSVLPKHMQAAVDKVLATHKVFRGPGGTILLRRLGSFYPPGRAAEIRDFLDSPWRFEILRRLRKAPGSTELTEVPVERFDPSKSFEGRQENHTGYWFLLHPGREPERFVARSQAVRVAFNRLIGYGRKGAVNNSLGMPVGLVGIVQNQGHVHTRIQNGLELLICCPPHTMRRFDLLVANKGGGLQLLRFEASREQKVELDFSTGDQPCDFLVATDTKGRARVFKHP